MSSDLARKQRHYRRFVIVFSIITGIALGAFLGSIAALADTWAPILFVVLPLGLGVIGRVKGWHPAVDPAVWLLLAVALPVECATAVLMPHDAAAFGIGLAVAMWFVLIVVGGVLEIVFDPDGTIAGSTDAPRF